MRLITIDADELQQRIEGALFPVSTYFTKEQGSAYLHGHDDARHAAAALIASLEGVKVQAAQPAAPGAAVPAEQTEADPTQPVSVTAISGERRPIDANELERIAKERPDDYFLKGSGVLKLIGGIRQLEHEMRAMHDAAAPAAPPVQPALRAQPEAVQDEWLEKAMELAMQMAALLQAVPKRLPMGCYETYDAKKAELRAYLSARLLPPPATGGTLFVQTDDRKYMALKEETK
jgi:hypothetical protein